MNKILFETLALHVMHLQFLLETGPVQKLGYRAMCYLSVSVYAAETKTGINATGEREGVQRRFICILAHHQARRGYRKSTLFQIS